MPNYILHSEILAIHLGSSSVTQIPAESQIMVADDRLQTDLPDNFPNGTTIVVWRHQQYGVFLVDLQTKGSPLA